MNLIEFFEQHNIPFRTHGEHHHCREGWVNVDCPFCGKDTNRWHMGFNLSHNYVNCWRCGSHRLGDTLAELTGIPLRRILGQIEGIQTTHRKERKHAGKFKPPKGVSDLMLVHREYLKKRGFNSYELERLWGIKGIGLTSQLSWRIYIPIHLHGIEVSWTTRAVGRADNRYIAAKPEQESISRKELLYGWDYVRHSVIVCEGPTDVWRIGPGAVATMSTQFTPQQVALLAKIPRRVICFDNEVPAQRRARSLISELIVFPGETVNVVLDADDPGSAEDDEVRALREFLR